MTTNAKIKKDIQTLNVGSGLVELYSLDLTSLGGSVHYFTPGTLNESQVTFNSIEYTPLPVKVEGMKWEGDGKMPRPTVTVSNITLALLAEVVAYDDFVGAKFTRTRTYAKYLDGEAGADPDAAFPMDIFFVERKIRQNKYLLAFELKAAVDLENVYVPKRQALEICQHIYRVWNGSSFDYTYATCPYTDTDYYDASGAATTAENDACGQKLFDCKLRFPSTSNADDQLPGRFFPGVGRFGRPYRR